ncbi:MAG: beta-N-acetylglucosaminidase domain-containing protein, partial [Gammaproteobacteria bacterium]
MASVARETGEEFVYAISPGGTMVYADSGEYDTLKRKLDEIGALGVTAFALFLDDVPPTLEHDADRAAFESVAEAHASVINRLYRDLSETGATLAVTPTTYTNAWGDREYLRQLGELVVPEVPFFWTGVDVAAPEITAEQASEWAALMSREPLIWDNYPVNDFARWRPFLGPLQHRGPNLSNRALGILSNPMNEAHASMIPLATLAEYVRDPRSYEPAAAQERTLVELYGEDVAEALGPFVTIYAGDAWAPNLFQPLFIPGETIDVDAVFDGMARLDESVAGLETFAQDRPDIRALVDELEPFVAQTRSRLEELEADSRYETRDGRLAFRSELDRKVIAAGEAPAIDGDIGEWTSDTWYDLHGPGNANRARAAFRYDSQFVYAAVNVPYTPQTVRHGARVGEGDHVALVVQHDAVASRIHLTPDDIVVLVSPPTQETESEVIIRSIDMGAFT